MIKKIRIYLAFIMAPLLPVIIFTPSFVNEVWLIASAVSYSITLFFGLPVYFHLKKLNGLKLIPISFGTFMIGVIIGLLLLIPESADNMTLNGVIMIKNGTYTLSGILHEVKSVLLLGILGLITGAFWWLIGIATYNKSSNLTGANNVPPS